MKIVLIGFMGSGKSSVGKLLSKKLDMEFVEMDQLILKDSNRESIREIFKKDGENKFRELEKKVAESLANKKNAVISTGGGVVINEINIDNLKKAGVIIYLETNFDKVKERLEGVNDRPLFQDKEGAVLLYKKRQPLYNEFAQVTIRTDGFKIEQVVDEIIKNLELIHTS